MVGEVLVILLSVGGLFVVAGIWGRASNSRKPKSLLDYVLLWPLIIERERERDPARADRVFTVREWIGWGVVLLLILVASIES